MKINLPKNNLLGKSEIVEEMENEQTPSNSISVGKPTVDAYSNFKS
jgi:hypothetical protein